MIYNKEDYHKIVHLFSLQNWLYRKKDELNELLDFCKERESKDLVFSLLERFHYLQAETLQNILNDIAAYIVDDSGFCIDTTQILSITYDDEADSSQKILDMIKMPLYQKGWRDVKTVNHYRSSIKNYSKGRTQIIIIDEFIGSGKTLRGRIKQLKNDIKGEFELKCCFVAGIKAAIKNLTEEGIDIFCPLLLNRGISDFYKDDELVKAENIMLGLELRLAQQIKSKKLYDYSFGYGNAEALYTMEGCNGNTPNSVFPLFWWIKDFDDKERRTLLTRFESGF